VGPGGCDEGEICRKINARELNIKEKISMNMIEYSVLNEKMKEN
jgi:hypothetical protein